MSKATEAKQLLEHPIFQYAMHETREAMVEAIEQDPLESVEAAIGLKWLKYFESTIESMVFDAKVAEYTQEQSTKYQ